MSASARITLLSLAALYCGYFGAKAEGGAGIFLMFVGGAICAVASWQKDRK